MIKKFVFLQKKWLTKPKNGCTSPSLLLLDENTAALDPKTAKKVLELTDDIVRRNQLTTLMIMHCMKGESRAVTA